MPVDVYLCQAAVAREPTPATVYESTTSSGVSTSTVCDNGGRDDCPDPDEAGGILVAIVRQVPSGHDAGK